MIEELVRRLREDKVSGAGKLSEDALRILKEASFLVEASGREEFLLRMEEIAQEISSARPSMTPLANLSLLFLKLLREEGEGDLEALRRKAAETAEKLILLSASARERASSNAARLLERRERIITCSLSSAVISALKKAKEEGKEIEVLAALSPGPSGNYGELLAQALRGEGIEVSVFPDEELEIQARRATRALVGADTVLPDGSFINGSPTLSLAVAARKNNIPLFSVCETFKIRRDPAILLEPGFDLVPSDLVCAYITEKGIIRPSEISRQQLL